MCESDCLMAEFVFLDDIWYGGCFWCLLVAAVAVLWVLLSSCSLGFVMFWSLAGFVPLDSFSFTSSSSEGPQMRVWRKALLEP